MRKSKTVHENHKECIVSVAMAVFNGEKYVEEQIRSILVNLSPQDELIVSDDGSTDRTVEIIEKMISEDARISLYSNSDHGIKGNFENAIRHCKGDYIFLSDQDDLWAANKVSTVMKAFRSCPGRTGKSSGKKKECLVVCHNASLMDADGKPLVGSMFELRRSGPGFMHNFIKNGYMGCCMAFDARLKSQILPIPSRVFMHDQWIGMLGEQEGRTVFLKDRLIAYRRHDKNVTELSHGTLPSMLTKRFFLCISLLLRRLHCRFN